jgi:pimeloyl-ACP methyl ester carboxylesterase
MSDAQLTAPGFARTVCGSGPGLILAHGAGGSVQVNFGPILDGLAANHTVVGVDLPGAGETPRSATPLQADEAADQLIAAGDAEGLGSFAIAGWSLGAPLAIHAAARHPDRVSSLILTSPFARADARLELAATIWRELYESGDHVLLFKFLILVARGTQALEAMSPDQRDAAAEAAARFIPPGTPEHADLVGRIDVLSELAQIEAPTLVISTTDDRLVAPRLHEQVARGISGAQLTELHTGHLAFLEDPDGWLSLMTRFLAERSGVR